MIPYSIKKLQQYFLQNYNIAVTLQNFAAIFLCCMGSLVKARFFEEGMDY